MKNLLFVRFVLIGAVCALINIISRILLSHYIELNRSIVFSYIFAMTVAFILNRKYVFDSVGMSLAAQYFRFALVNLIALLQVWLITLLFVDYILPWLGWHWYPEATGHMVGVASPIVTSYFGHKYFSFRATPNPNQASKVNAPLDH